MPLTRTPHELLRDLVALPGPPGQENAVREYVASRATEIGCVAQTDAKGNLLIGTGAELPTNPAIVVTAHLDEIALMVHGIDPDGAVRVGAMGGAFAWKWGEGPVEILLTDGTFLPGVLSIGGIHTTSPASTAFQARSGTAPGWSGVRIVTGMESDDLAARGVRPGTRVVIARARRTLFPLGGDLIAGYFLDDRADLVAMLLALAAVRDNPAFANILWIATSSEEVGGEGALFALQKYRPDICVALEIGPTTPDAPFPLDANPTVWVTDSYAAMDPRDLDLVVQTAAELGLAPHFHAVTRGGSDASCAASHGLCARPVTLAFAAENSHGFEIMHRAAPESLARLCVGYLERVVNF